MKMDKKLQKICLSYHNLLIVQDLWETHYQILSIIFLKKFIELNVNSNTMIKNVKLSELHTTVKYINFKDDLIEHK